MNKSEVFQNFFNREKISDFKINNVSINSKELNKNDIFVAIRGGNSFVNEALEKGAFAVYDSEAVKIDEKYAERAFFVKDSIEFLQKFAREWRKNLDIKVIGITGSNGKTTVKDMIYHLLSQKYKGKKTEGNYNNHIGLPFTLLRAEKDDDFIILEMGMSDFGEIDLLGQIALPDINVITNIGESHLEFLKTKENVFLAKTEIIPHIKSTLVINGDDKYLKNVKAENIEIVRALNLRNNEYEDKTSDFYYGDIHFDESGTNFFLKYFGKMCQSTVERNYKTNVLGEHNVLNLVMAIAVAKQFRMEDKIISEAVKNIELTGMRFQIIENGNTTYINDAYNASPMSMKKSLETFSLIFNDKLKIMVLGDMLELGERELEIHRDLFDTIKNTNFDKLYLFGERMKSLLEKIKENMDNGNLENESLKNKEFEYFDERYEISKHDNLTILKDNLFDEVSTQENSQGIIFLYSKNLNTIEDIKGDVVILDDIQDPGNAGTIIRTMIAANFQNLILTKGSVDVYNPKTVRATMSGIFKLNLIYETPENIVKFLNNKNYLKIATALHEDSISYEKIELRGNNAFIFGHEGGGVSEYLIENSDIKAIIPIYGNIESLNVSVATGIFLYKMREKLENL